MDLANRRQQFVQHIHEQLTGKNNIFPEGYLKGENPLDRFVTGFLFPVFESEEGIDDEPDEVEEASENEDASIQATTVTKRKRYIPPSSVGFSFFISGNSICLRVFYNAICYRKGENQNELGQYQNIWEKIDLTDDNGEEVVFTPNGQKFYEVFKNGNQGRAKIEILWRQYKTGYIVTITLLNTQQISQEMLDNPKEFVEGQNKKSLFNVELSCIVESGELNVYPSKDKALLSDEEKEIELRYKDQHIYAVGHGAAADWKTNSERKNEIFADFMPMVEVPQVTANTDKKDNKALNFYFLSNEPKEAVIKQLNDFIQSYHIWIKQQEKQVSREELDEQETAKNIVEKQKNALKRMQQGVRLLESDDLVWQAFTTMNEAMLMQWKAGKPTAENENFAWRPFQLAFVLMTLESSINGDSEERDIVDLIWFPTGGGKTEAYLGLMAFLFLYRRMKYPASAGGTITIMRYTLRLLTTQQFLRANKVIFALELIRRKNSELYGREAFSSGLWVGGASSPNTFTQVKDTLEKEQYSKLVVTHCPWCNGKLHNNNYCLNEDSFHLTCNNKKCDFGGSNNNVLPCNVVDESLYQSPPTLLLATVDKFARLAWEERAGVFFGGKNNRPPELIIQDELHLISSALGSIVGLYEAGIDTALISRGMRCKYVASTATIKHANEQVRSLFAREMQVFPPSGLRYEDAYFAKSVPLEQKPGRLYVGYLAPLLSRQNCMAPLAASLLAAPVGLFTHEEEYMDKWWTQIVYHGSLKGVNNSRTLYQNQIETRLNKFVLGFLKQKIEVLRPNFTNDKKLENIDDFKRISDPEIKDIVDQYIPIRDIDNIKALNSNQTAEENAEIFTHLAKEKDEANAIDAALATNMISVGLDVSRLALMIINGQPLTTAEYIQASSRVGRGDTPGIVYVNFYKTQARSLSHYENFRSYHDAFYRYVEPSSLTPFTYQARQRALHAALVIAIRHSGVGLVKNEKAEVFDKNNDAVKKVVHDLKIRCKRAISNTQEQKATEENINTLIEEWKQHVDYCNEQRMSLVYYSKDRAQANLLCDFDKNNGLWKTLNSMRNVENTALMKLLSGVKEK
ncbi:Superfamily II DNA and RNA helicase [hydrothermal vent metagenome]|uniref:Superfamily II DNA and RNA helicase n=1 Tax=hydrothermal vent metagenome TaxID=652676 RepID=A0A3B0VWU7_9ZZZZ